MEKEGIEKAVEKRLSSDNGLPKHFGRTFDTVYGELSKQERRVVTPSVMADCCFDFIEFGSRLTSISE